VEVRGGKGKLQKKNIEMSYEKREGDIKGRGNKIQGCIITISENRSIRKGRP